MKYYVTPRDDDSRHYDIMMFTDADPEASLAVLLGNMFPPNDIETETTVYVDNDVFDRYFWNPARAYNQESIRRFMGPLQEDQEEIRREHNLEVAE